MYDQKRIKESFVSLAGIRQNDNPTFGQLSPSLLYTGDNVLINHPLVNIENLDMTARNYGKYVFPTYNPATPYVIGDRVTSANINYEALGSTTGDTPATSPLAWKVLNLLDLFLQDIWTNAAEDMIAEVFNRKKVNQQIKTMLSSLRFYDGIGNVNDLIVNEGALVGVQIKLTYQNNILAIIEKVGMQLSQANPELTFYLYHSSQLEPIATVEVNHTKVSSFQWHDLTPKLKINYLSPDYDSGGAFFFMYDQSALVGQAIKKNHNFHALPCSYCNSYNIDAFAKYSKYIYMHAVKVPASVRNGINLWDITKTQLTPDTNYGLNFEMTVRCDVTNFLIQQKDVFQYAFRDMVTKKLLEAMANSTRQNSAQTKLDVLARNELMATYAGGMGFMKQLETQLSGVGFELQDLDAACMPCGRKGGIGYGSHALSGGH